VVCPPYDVVTPEERISLEKRSLYNAARVELPLDGHAGDRYRNARFLLDSWRDEGVLVRDPVPAFYGHRMIFKDPEGNDRTTTGAIGALTLEPPGTGILPHELTMPKPKGDRLELLRTARANLSPIWGLSLGAGLSEACEAPSHPLVQCVDIDGTAHSLWPITDPDRVSAIRAVVASDPVIIADGHHRYETALEYQAERHRAGDGPGDHDAVMALIVELTEGQLSVHSINRLISGLPDGFDVAEALSKTFELVPAGPVGPGTVAKMNAAGALFLITPEGTWLARPRPETVSAATHPELDSSLLDVALGGFPEHELRYQHGAAAAAGEVTKGAAQAAVLIRPATVDQIARIGRGGYRMPAKTTFFWPKPRTGLVLRELVG
jgi:uncharacterized protein (DUF1015 family)